MILLPGLLLLFVYGVSLYVRRSFDYDSFPCFALLISSPEPPDSQGELIVYTCSGVRLSSVVCQPFTKISFDITWPNFGKFHVEPPWEGGTKVCINDPSHMTKMVVTFIYRKGERGFI